MISTEQIVIIVFRLINLGVVIGLLGYIFKKYVLSTIKNHIAEKNAYVRGLQEQYRSLLYQQEQGLVVAREEALVCEQLKQQVTRWKQVVEKEQQVRSEEKEERKRMFEEHRAHKEQQIALLYVKKQAIPRIIQNVEKELQQRFADEKVGRQYVQTIITRMH
jgi:hypothetical protein